MRYSIIVFLALFAFISEPVKAGPFLKINRIDADSEFPNVKIYMTVCNIDKVNITGLDDENLIIYEDGNKINILEVKNFSEIDDYLYLVFSIDSSKSISEKFLTNIKSSAKEIINSVGPKDKVAIYKFNDQVNKLNDFTSRKDDLIRNINGIYRHGSRTLLFNSIYDSIDLFGKVKGKRKAIIVFTDGKDEGSSINHNDIINFSRDLKIPIYFICLKTSKNIKTLAKISKLTGGMLVYSNEYNDVAGMYKTILNFIKSKYLVKYQTANESKGIKHHVEVRLKYDVIRDRETVNYKVKKKLFDFDLKSGANIILLGLIALLLILLIVILIFFLKREKKNLKEVYDSDYKTQGIKSYYKDVIEQSDREIEENDNILSSMDPEFSYSDAWIVQKDGPETGKKFPIYWDESTIGRGDDNSIVVKDEAISLNHAKIKNINGVFHLFDLVSDNGIYLNGKKLLRPRPLYDWDEFMLGRTHFIFRGSKIAKKEK